VPEAQIKNAPFFELGHRQWNIPELEKLFKDILPKNMVFESFTVKHEFPNIGPKVLRLTGRQIVDAENSESALILLVIEDITDRLLEGYGVNEMFPAHERPQSFEEEIANGVSHGIAFVACLIATPFLISLASRFGDAWSLVGPAIFAGATIFMYLSSTLYHVLPANRAKRVLQVLDRGAMRVHIPRLHWASYAALGAGAF
jgi:Haemolysin-III related